MNRPRRLARHVHWPFDRQAGISREDTHLMDMVNVAPFSIFCLTENVE